VPPDSSPPPASAGENPNLWEQEILTRIKRGEHGAWELFLESFGGVLFGVVALFAESYDDRMDLFLHLCTRLREGEMRRIRRFRYRMDAPCRFSSYLAVVAKNLCVDYLRSRQGRFRPFRRVAAMDETDRLLFNYHIREGRNVEEARGLLLGRHGIRLGIQEASDRAGKIYAALSANQRWKLLARLASKRRALPIDPVAGVALGTRRAFPLESEREDPERSLRREEAEQVFQNALDSVDTRRRLALVLRFRDSMSAEEIAQTLAVSEAEAERIIGEGLEVLRLRLRACGVQRSDLESPGWAALWAEKSEGRG